jgi:hypothetical protein
MKFSFTLFLALFNACGNMPGSGTRQISESVAAVSSEEGEEVASFNFIGLKQITIPRGTEYGVSTLCLRRGQVIATSCRANSLNEIFLNYDEKFLFKLTFKSRPPKIPNQKIIERGFLFVARASGNEFTYELSRAEPLKSPFGRDEFRFSAGKFTSVSKVVFAPTVVLTDGGTGQVLREGSNPILKSDLRLDVIGPPASSDAKCSFTYQSSQYFVRGNNVPDRIFRKEAIQLSKPVAVGLKPEALGQTPTLQPQKIVVQCRTVDNQIIELTQLFSVDERAFRNRETTATQPTVTRPAVTAPPISPPQFKAAGILRLTDAERAEINSKASYSVSKSSDVGAAFVGKVKEFGTAADGSGNKVIVMKVESIRFTAGAMERTDGLIVLDAKDFHGIGRIGYDWLVHVEISNLHGESDSVLGAVKSFTNLTKSNPNLQGDVDGNGIVNKADGEHIISVLGSRPKLNRAYYYDVDRNGVVTASDALRVMRLMSK